MLHDLEGHIARARLAGLSVAELAAIRETIRKYDDLLGDDGAWLAHGDCDVTHIFSYDGVYSGIIDFGEIRGAPRLYDLAHHRLHDGERLPFETLPWLLEGYRQQAQLPDDYWVQINLFSMLVALRALGRGMLRNPKSQIVRVSERAIRRELDELRSF